ncbi:MAG: hypothetical protein IKH84_06545 [Ottowia sp.]|nr:hypothetical protein [Ottowia sp.]
MQNWKPSNWIAIIALLLYVVCFAGMFYREWLAKKLYICVNGTSRGYSWRKFRKNMDDFAVPPHEELALKVKALDRLLTWLTLALLMMFLLALLAKERGL